MFCARRAGVGGDGDTGRRHIFGSVAGLASRCAIGPCCSVSNNTAKIRAAIATEGGAAVGCRIGRAGAGGLMLSLGAAAPALAAGEHYDTAMGFALALFFFLGFLLYIVPAVVAWDRQHPDVRWIWALTLLLGWTGIGWLLALIWALRSTGADRGHPHARPADSS